MTPKTRKTSRSSFAGRAAGQDTSVFQSALHSVYGRARGLSNGRQQWVISPRTRQRVGIILREQGLVVFQRLVSESGQRLNKFGGAWALETDLLAHVERLGATWYRVITTDTGRMLHAPIRAFREHGMTISSARYGVQSALPERYFRDYIQGSQETEAVTQAEESTAQPSLFEVNP